MGFGVQLKYVTTDMVKSQLADKVVYANNPNDGLTTFELEYQTSVAEGIVEQCLSELYVVDPELMSYSTGDFAGLPDTTKSYIQQFIIWQAVLNILNLMFGRNSATVGADYAINAQYQVDTYKKNVLRYNDSNGMYKYNFLKGLKVNKFKVTGYIALPEAGVVDPAPCGKNNNTKWAQKQLTKLGRSYWQNGVNLDRIFGG